MFKFKGPLNNCAPFFWKKLEQFKNYKNNVGRTFHWKKCEIKPVLPSIFRETPFRQWPTEIPQLLMKSSMILKQWLLKESGKAICNFNLISKVGENKYSPKEKW